MAKKKTKRKARRRGGRTPGAWSLLTQGSLKAFRKQAGLSRAALAKLLHVSSTSVQNWETGRAIPVPRFQEQLVSLMQGGVPPAAVPEVGSSARPRSNGTSKSVGAGREASLRVTSEILRSYLATPKGGTTTGEQLVALTTSLRAALS